MALSVGRCGYTVLLRLGTTQSLLLYARPTSVNWGEALMFKSNKGPQGLKVMEVHNAFQKTQMVFSELRAAEGAQPVIEIPPPVLPQHPMWGTCKNMSGQ